MVKENKNNGTSTGNKEFNRVNPVKQEIVSITYEEIGFFPRSFSRVLDRFLKQVFSDVENLVIQEYRFYRYLFLTTLQCLLILFFVPFLVNFFAKTYLVRPLTEYFWNTQQTEIFLNSYQQKRAFSELKDFEEKIYFESLITPISKSSYNINNKESSPHIASLGSKSSNLWETPTEKNLETNITKPLLAPPASPTLVGYGGSSVRPKDNETSLGDKANNNSPLAIRTVADTKKNDISFLTTLVSVEPKLETKSANNNNIENTLALPKPSGPPTERSPVRTIDNNAVNVSDLDPSGVPRGAKNSKRDTFEQRLQDKTIELAIRYNNQSVEAITNFFADLLSFITLCYLLFVLEIQINITKSFLLEVFFGLDDSKKSLFILLITDLLVGYHSSNLWELFFEFLFHHYGLPESQTGIFLLVATLPVLLDVLFKYLIFRHLNRSSPATVATYHAMIE